MTLQFFGHSAFLIELDGKKLLFDPFIKGNPVNSDLDLKSITADYVLLTHGHGDHTGDTLEIIQNCGARLISNYEIFNHFNAFGIHGYGLNIGGELKLDFCTIKLVTAVHSSSLPDGSYGGNPVGFVIWNSESCFYVSGDTALTLDMKLIPMTCPTLNFAILCIGDLFTMGYKDAAIAADFIQCKKIIGCHYDTFPPIVIDKEKVLHYFQTKDLELILPRIGEVIDI
ncbi:MAG: metal-dependent hydrolase [Saprospiraceae bacterium]|nr:metal-dependent hydrolase [Saprospiraceae bacterium]